MDRRVLVVCFVDEPPTPIPGAEVWAYAPGRNPFRHNAVLEERLKSWQPDVVVFPSVYTPAVIPLLSFLSAEGIRYVMRPGGGYGYHNEQRNRVPKRVYKRLFELPALNRAEFIWSIGDTKDIVAYGASRPIVETRKGRDIPTETSVPRQDSSLYQGMEDRFIFGFVGRLDPVHKGLDLTLRGFELADLSDASMLLAGPHVARSELRLRREINRLGLQSQVRTLSPIFGPEKDSFVGNLDVFFHLSRWEGGVPYAVIEAASLGRPLLLTSAADPGGLFAGLDAAVIVEPNPASVAAGMQVLHNLSSADRAALGQRARDAVNASFGWDLMAADFLAALSAYGIGN